MGPIYPWQTFNDQDLIRSQGIKMLSRLKLSRRMAIVAGSIVMLGIGTLAALSMLLVHQSGRENAQQSKESMLASLERMLVMTEDISKASTNQLAAAFAGEFEGKFALHDQPRLKIGDIQAPLLEHDGEVLNLNFYKVDNFTRRTGGVATVFARIDDDFVRISTSLRKEDRTRAIGTLLGKQHPAYANMMAGKEYLGVARLFGKSYMTQYQPIKSADGQVIGILFVGFDLTDTLSKIRDAIAEQRSYQSGYVFAVHRSGAQRGQAFYHPALTGQDVLEAPDARGENAGFLKPLLEQDSGGFDAWMPGRDGTGAIDALVEFKQTPAWGGMTLAVVSPNDEIDAAADTVMLVLGAGGLVLALLVIGALVVVVNASLKPLAVLRNTVDRMGAGDLTVRATAGDDGRPTGNELTLLARGLDATASRMSELLRGVKQAAEEVRQTSAGLNRIGSELVNASEQGGMAVEHMESAIVEMAGSMEAVGENAEEARNRSVQANQVTQESASAIGQTVHDMQTLATSVERSATVIAQLGEESRRISAVTQIIREIAEQTNLLALNAAIEAARAGEQGRGFSVVADEVRKLAERTAQSTQEITAMLGSIQTGADEATRAMEQAVEQVKTGVDQVKLSGEHMDRIRRDVQAAAEQIEAISHALREQSQARASIQDSAHRVSTLASSNREISDRSAQSAQQMDQVAQRLINSVDRFTLR